MARCIFNSIVLLLLIFTVSHFYSLSIASFSASSTVINGTLTVCDGVQFSVTCTHGNVGTGVTFWVFNPPLEDCASRTIYHDSSSPIPQECTPFTFRDISTLKEQILNSTLEAVASELLNGIYIECRDSGGDTFTEIGNVTLCVTGKDMYLMIDIESMVGL